MKFFYRIILLAGIFIAGTAQAESNLSLENRSLDDDSVAIYGAACEKIKQGDVKSSVRARVTDKASFLAVGDIADLADFRKNMDEHDFNVMTYNIVDNMIEDMTVRTVKQDDEEICVEITGFIHSENIFAILSDYVNNMGGDSAQMLAGSQSVGEGSPEVLASARVVPEKSTKSLVYVAPLEFYNNTRSSQHSQVIRDLFDNSDVVSLTFDPTKADYIVRPKVLRAKVEAVNEENSRLQMVVSIEMEGTKEKNRLTEKQNRFVLFSKAEKEQTVASNLMKKLLDKAGSTIVKRIERDAGKKQKANGNRFDSIISPQTKGA
ncbi:MAG: hypothetical protein LBL47_03555 [Lactobacillus sp.]|jgi:hypothetical protein|nr:hypothetical protein [Lactobacillus sp.]